MKTNHPLIRTALLASAVAVASFAQAEGTSIRVDQRAPLRATLLPTVTVTADINAIDTAPNWNVDDTTPLRVTLMPTVRVTPDVDQLAVTVLPTVKVTASVSALVAKDAVSAARKVLAATPAKLPTLAQAARTVEIDRTATESASPNRLGVTR